MVGPTAIPRAVRQPDGVGAAGAAAAPDESRRQLLKAERDRFVAFAFCWADLLMELDAQGRVLFAIGAAEELTGQAAASLMGQHFARLIVPQDLPIVAEVLRSARAHRRIEVGSLRLRRSDRRGTRVALVGHAVPELMNHAFLALRLSSSALPGFQADADDPGDRADATRMFARSASEAIRELQRRDETPGFALVALEQLPELRARLDEITNERLQRTIDTCIQASAVSPETATRVADGRYGFVHRPDMSLSDVQTQLAAAVRSVDPLGIGVPVETADIDLSTQSEVSEADLAKGLMFVMNKFSENAGETFSLSRLSQNLSSFLDEAVVEVTTFKEMVQLGAFDLALQPIIRVNTAVVHHFEALCRFHRSDPSESPYRYIRFAEEIGLIHEFDLAIVRKALAWLREDRERGGDNAIAVNFSGHSIETPAFVDCLHGLLAENRWSQGRLRFELTESAKIRDLAAANTFMQSLRSLGYRVCLDDFGSGAASFEYLSHLDIDAVKVDGSALKSARRARKGPAFLSALTELCRKLNIASIAEMVDDLETLEFARACGCDFVQGYLFGRPAADVRAFQPLPNVEQITPAGR
ncbi:MAG: EAL domain-containing protein [Rhodospirillaceae bacterium]|nr:EAL domain-containing protein [Rhodospirillaceae bacterium]